jgi:hypothetical protein
VFDVVVKALGMVAEKSRVGGSQKRRYLGYILWCCCAWLSLIFIQVLNRDKGEMTRESYHAGGNVIFLSRRRLVSLNLHFT